MNLENTFVCHAVSTERFCELPCNRKGHLAPHFATILGGTSAKEAPRRLAGLVELRNDAAKGSLERLGLNHLLDLLAAARGAGGLCIEGALQHGMHVRDRQA